MMNEANGESYKPKRSWERYKFTILLEFLQGHPKQVLGLSLADYIPEDLQIEDSRAMFHSNSQQGVQMALVIY